MEEHPKPSIGRIVHYRLSASDVEQITRRRTTGASIAERMKADRWPAGAQAHIGNPASPGQIVPLVVTAVWPDEYPQGARLLPHPEGTEYESRTGVNGQALLDGSDTLWVTSAPEHPTLDGCWHWPPRT